MKRILYPTDFSPASLNAFVYALKLAEATQSELFVLHVYELPQLHMGGMTNTLKEIYDTIELENFENLKDQVPMLRKIADEHQMSAIRMSHILKHGDLIWAITNVVTSESIDYVVMGTKGASGLKETFLGSNTGSVMTETEAIVIGIPEEAVFTDIKNIVFTTRYRDKDIKALQKVLQLAKVFDAHVHCLYVKTSKSEVNEVVFQDWKFLFKDEKVVFHTIVSDQVKESILEFTQEYKVDLLAMLNYKRGFFEELFSQSLTQKLSFHVKVPLLALHEKAL